MKKHVGFLALILLLTTFAYSNSFKNDFTVDDHLFIVDWPLIEDLKNWPQYFSHKSQPEGEEGVYSPLKTCIHAINYHFFGLEPFGHHVFSLMVHWAGTIFAYLITFLLTQSLGVSLIVGLLFGLHPVHVEGITAMTGAVDTTGVVFCFIAFYFFIRHMQETHDRKHYVISLVFSFLAIFTHELVITLPALFLWYIFVFYRGKMEFKQMCWKTLPFFVITGIYVPLKIIILGSVARGGYLYDSFYLTMLLISKSIAQYVLILMFPFTLIADHQISPGIYSVDAQYFDQAAVLTQSIFDLQVLFSIAFTLTILYWGYKNFKTNPLITFCVGWFYILLFPVSNIIPTGTYFTERYLYPGSLTFCIVLGLALHKLYMLKEKRSYRAIIAGIISLICIFYSVRTYLRNADFENEVTFYQAEVKGNPEHPIMNRDLGVSLLVAGAPQKAIGYLEKAIQLLPNDEHAYFALAQSHARLEHFTKALAYYKKSIDINPEFAESFYNLSGLYGYLGKPEISKKYLTRAMELYEKQGRLDEVDELKSHYTKILGY